MVRYFVRLDDACPSMHHERWRKVLDSLDRHGVHPMIGVIPSNQDPMTMTSPADSAFWDKIRARAEKGDPIALHGFNHCCDSESGGINPVHQRSEFAGLPLDEQRVKIRDGYRILTGNGLQPEFFFAPSHTFDATTLTALREETPIRNVCDTVALRPYTRDGFLFIPQQMGRFRDVKVPGYWVICYHPTFMTDAEIAAFDSFLSSHRSQFGDFRELTAKTWKTKSPRDRLLQRMYFIMRKLR